MFGKTKTELKNLEVEKTLIDREIDLYRREKMQMVNSDIENEKIKRLKEVANLEIECHKQIADYEHEFHSTKEIRGIEPTYNSMVVNSATEKDPHNLHCVTCIVPGTIKKRITIQWRTNKIDKNKKNNLIYQ